MWRVSLRGTTALRAAPEAQTRSGNPKEGRRWAYRIRRHLPVRKGWRDICLSETQDLAEHRALITASVSSLQSTSHDKREDLNSLVCQRHMGWVRKGRAAVGTQETSVPIRTQVPNHRESWAFCRLMAQDQRRQVSWEQTGGDRPRGANWENPLRRHSDTRVF